MNKNYPNLFSPIKIGKLTFKNRLVSAPNMMSNITPAGYPTDYMIGYYESKAKGGCAQVTVGDTPIDEEHAPSIPRHLVLAEPNLPWLSELAKAIRQHGAVASIELNHGGLTASPAITGNNPIGPTGFVRADGVPVAEMDEAMINRVADNYARAAALIKTAGFDMCLIHGAHGWLLDQFLSPYFNQRADGFGGSLRNRARFPIMVIDRVRETVGPDFPIEYRIGAELIEDGLPIEEVIEFIKMVEDKIDLVHVSAALDTIGKFAVITHPTMFLPNGCNVKYAEAVKKEVNIPVTTVGAITTPELAEQIIAEGKADIVAMTRAIIADPDFANKARTGRGDEIITCVRCLDCLAVMQATKHFACTVNPRTGREFRLDYTIKPAKASRKVLVVGGGPAGMKAAITAAERGHEVTLVEEKDSLGGLLRFADYDPVKVDLKRFRDYLIRMVARSGVKVICNIEATAEFVTAVAPDALIVAAGSLPVVPNITGIEHTGVKHAIEAYREHDQVGDKVVVIGGGLVGCEVALFLAESGRDVTVVEMLATVAPDSNWMHKEGMMQAMARNNVTVLTNTTCKEITDGGVKVVTVNGQERFLKANSVIYSVGLRSCSEVVEKLRALDTDYFAAVGDCVKVEKVSGAIFAAYHAAIDIA
jgi:2,4-dienoyl-CoA reductase-like NADH-dependent reductase (Old Yellow Enzyme family)/thioredoxin reductase